MSKGIVYCLTNPAMPDLVKIGFVKSADASKLKKRMSNLYRTSVPMPFKLHYAVVVDAPEATERLLRDSFAGFRVNDSREFFRVEPEKVVRAMKLTGGGSIPVDDPDAGISQADIKERDRLRKQENKRLSRFKFSDAHINAGKTLTFSRDPAITAEVIGGNKIKFENEETTLSGAAKKILERMGLYGDVAGPAYWEYKGKNLATIRKEREEGNWGDD